MNPLSHNSLPIDKTQLRPPAKRARCQTSRVVQDLWDEATISYSTLPSRSSHSKVINSYSDLPNDPRYVPAIGIQKFLPIASPTAPASSTPSELSPSFYHSSVPIEPLGSQSVPPGHSLVFEPESSSFPSSALGYFSTPSASQLPYYEACYSETHFSASGAPLGYFSTPPASPLSPTNDAPEAPASQLPHYEAHYSETHFSASGAPLGYFSTPPASPLSPTNDASEAPASQLPHYEAPYSETQLSASGAPLGYFSTPPASPLSPTNDASDAPASQLPHYEAHYSETQLSASGAPLGYFSTPPASPSTSDDTSEVPSSPLPPYYEKYYEAHFSSSGAPLGYFSTPPASPKRLNSEAILSDSSTASLHTGPLAHQVLGSEEEPEDADESDPSFSVILSEQQQADVESDPLLDSAIAKFVPAADFNYRFHLYRTYFDSGLSEEKKKKICQTASAFQTTPTPEKNSKIMQRLKIIDQALEKKKCPSNVKVDYCMAIGSFGLRATKRINPGTVIGIYTGQIIKDSGIPSESAYCFNIGGNYVTDATQVGNYTRYINHSSKNFNAQPSLTFLPDCQAPQILIVATKRILPGQWILYDYKEDYFNHLGIEAKDLHPNDI